MKANKLFIGLAVIATSLLASQELLAQQHPQYSMSTFTRQVYNPAFVGEEGLTSLEIGGRNQWVNINGAPKTGVLAFETSLARFSNSAHSGLGIMIVHDEIGYFTSSSAGIQFAQGVRVGNSILSVGLGTSLVRDELNFSKANPAQINDPDLLNEGPEFYGDLSAGIRLGNPNYFVGASIKRFVTIDKNNLLTDQQPHAFAQFGVNLNQDGMIQVQPSAVLKSSFSQKRMVFNPEFALLLTYDNAVSLGANYRVDESLAAMIRFRANKMFSIGYAYDYGLNLLTELSGGSHELWLRFNIGKIAPRSIVTPRMFNYN